MKRNYGVYHVGLKILLKKGDEFLFLRGQSGKYWDLPGGRIDNTEDKVLLEKILEREVREELGKDLKYKLGASLFQFRRFIKSKGHRVFIVVYGADYVSGEIKLSSEHSGSEWLNPKTQKLKAKDFMNQEEYKAFKNYFENYQTLGV